MTATDARPRASGRRLLPLLAVPLLVALLVSTLGMATVQSGSMSPALETGDRLLFARGLPAEHGAVVIADGWADEGLIVKRVIGTAGDVVECCESGSGRLLVNDVPLDEPYAEGGGGIAFEARVPEGAVWLMGDARDRSSDSRAHRADEDGGSVPLERVRGRVLARLP